MTPRGKGLSICDHPKAEYILTQDERHNIKGCGPSGRYWEKRASDEKNAPAKKERR